MILVEFIKFCVMCIVLIIWSVVGFLFWIPLLFRIIPVYVVLILGSTLTGQNARGAGKILDKTTTFYSSGFKRIIDSVWTEDDGGDVALRFSWKRMIGETLFTALFWFGFYVLLELFKFL